jgi:hypothetical protein
LIAAVALPLFTCGFAAWVFPAYFGWARRDWRHLAAAAGYLGAMVFFVVVALTYASGPEAEAATDQEMLGLLGIFSVMITSAVHGAVVGARPGLSSSDRRADLRHRRDNARLLVHANPGAAWDLRIGRPDLPRWYDDGGLVDVNHVPGHVLAALPGVTAEMAHHIVVDRPVRGPFHSSDDLVIRGLVPAAVAHRISAQIICVPPYRQPTAGVSPAGPLRP